MVDDNDVIFTRVSNRLSNRILYVFHALKASCDKPASQLLHVESVDKATRANVWLGSISSFFVPLNEITEKDTSSYQDGYAQVLVYDQESAL